MAKPKTITSDELLSRASEQAKLVTRELNRLGQLCREAAAAIGNAEMRNKLSAFGSYAFDEADTTTDVSKRIDAIIEQLIETI